MLPYFAAVIALDPCQGAYISLESIESLIIALALLRAVDFKIFLPEIYEKDLPADLPIKSTLLLESHRLPSFHISDS